MADREYYVVIIGETGSGKSTFINYISNYFRKGSLQHPHIAIPTTYLSANMHYGHNENSVEDRTKSKTVDCQRYSFHFHQLLFHFIDTPGVNDTGGFTQDMQNVEKVFSYIENVPKLTAVILILNGAVARTTINIKNVLSIYRDRLPDAIYSNIIIVLTNCEEHTVNFSPVCVDLSEQCSVFHMQNSAFSSNPNTWSPTAINILEQHFNSSMKTMDRILNKILTLTPTSTKSFKDLSDDRNRIKQRLQLARMTIFDLQNMEDELAAFEVSAGIYAANAEKFRDFMQQRKVVRKQHIKTAYHNTLCLNCETVCHEDCSLKETRAPGSTSFFQCSAMNQYGQCRVCSKHCNAQSHYHDRYIIQRAEVPVVDIVDSMQQRYLQARDQKKKADSKCQDLQTSKALLESELQQQYNEVKESIANLRETCKDTNITAILFQFIELLEKDASNLKSSSVIQKSRKFITKLKSLCSTSGQSNETQHAVRSQPSDHLVWKKPSTPKVPGNDGNWREDSEIKIPDLSHPHGANGVSLPKAICAPMPDQSRIQSVENDGYESDKDKETYHDVHSEEPKIVDKGQAVFVEGSKQEEKLPIQQDMTDELLLFKREREKENIAMLPLGELLRLVNNGANNFNHNDIKTELQHRCNGESIGFLTCSEQILLCNEYVKHHQMNFRDLMRLSLKLNDDINGIIGGDPLKINLISFDQLLQLSAINLLIKSKK